MEIAKGRLLVSVYFQGGWQEYPDRRLDEDGCVDTYWAEDRTLRGLWHGGGGWRPWLCWHAGDEYGNCAIELGLKWLAITWFRRGLHRDHGFQLDVQLPEPGECEWTDRVMWGRETWLEHWKDGKRRE